MVRSPKKTEHQTVEARLSIPAVTILGRDDLYRRGEQIIFPCSDLEEEDYE